MEIIKNIKNFFTTTAPDFLKEYCLWVELGLFALGLIWFVAMLITHGGKRKYKKSVLSNTNELEASVKLADELRGKLETKSNEYTELSTKFDIAQNALNDSNSKFSELTQEHEVCKDMLSDAQMNLTAKTKECQDKDTKISDLILKEDSLKNETAELRDKILVRNEEVKNLTKQVEEQKAQIVKLSNDKEEAKKDMNDLMEDLEKMERTNSIMEREASELRKKNKELEEEANNLRDLETENKILIKTIRRLELSEDKKEKDSMVILNEKVENLEKHLSKKTEKRLFDLEKVEKNDLQYLPRTDLFELAKTVDLHNFATWSNDKLREEIGKHFTENINE